MCHYHLVVSANQKVTPFMQAVYEGRTVIINCYSVIVPTWLKDGKPLELGDLIHVSKFSLIISYAFQIHNGNYTCIGSSKNGTMFFAVSELLVGGMLNRYTFLVLHLFSIFHFFF